MAAETVPTFLEVSSVREQVTFDTFERFDQYDAVSHVKGTLDLEPVLNNVDLDEAVGTSSYQGSTQSQRGAVWKGTFKLKPKNPSDIDADLNQFNDSGGTVYVKSYDASDTVNGPADDLSTASNLDAFTSNYQLLPDAASEAVGDGFLIGHAKQFSRIRFDDLSTGNGSVATWTDDGGKYQYSTGEGVWSDLTVTDGTDTTAGDGLRSLQQTGSIDFTIPEDWKRATYDGVEAFWVRYYITATNLTQTAIIDDTNKDEPFVVNVDQMGPDIRAMIKAAMGWESVTGITSIAYKLSDSNIPDALQVQKQLEGFLQENVSGCMVNSMTMTCPVNEDPTFEFEGMGSRYGRTSKDVIGSGGIANAATSLPLNDASRGSVIEPCVLQIGDDSNSSQGYIVTDHSDTSGSADATISPGLVGAGESAGAEIKPFAPSSRDVSGTVLGGINYTLTVDGVTLKHLNLTAKVTTAYKLLDNESGSGNRPTGIAISRTRLIELEVSGYLKTGATGSAPIAGRSFDNPSHDVDLTIGSASGARFKVSAPAVEGRVSKLDMAKDDLVMVTISGRMKQASSAADEFSLELD